MTLSDLFWGDTTGLATVPTVADMGEMALEGSADAPFPGGLNDIIREEVEVRGLPLVVVAAVRGEGAAANRRRGHPLQRRGLPGHGGRGAGRRSLTAAAC